jgi:prolyl 4-hydroxylase
MTALDLEARASAGDLRAQVELAGRLDAEGRHYEALQWLSRAAHRQDAEALATLGLKLLTGANAPFRPVDGAGLLADAAGLGDGRAAAVLSVLSAGGFYAPQSWDAALGHLQRSAELGWAPAREQLAILGDDLKAWMAPPPVRVIMDRPRMLAIEGLAPPEACAWIVAQSSPLLVRAQVDDPRTGLPVMGQTRTNRVAGFELSQTSMLNLLIQHRIGAAVGAPVSVMEAFAVLNYRPGEEASEHFDYLDPAVPAYAEEIGRVGQRVATVLLYLNQDYEGGETEFPELGLKHRGNTGDALAFFNVDPAGAPDPRTLHAGRPPTQGEKWVLSQFVRDRALAPGAPG